MSNVVAFVNPYVAGFALLIANGLLYAVAIPPIPFIIALEGSDKLPIPILDRGLFARPALGPSVVITALDGCAKALCIPIVETAVSRIAIRNLFSII